MMGLSFWHVLAFGAVALLLFGGKFKISDIMGDVAKGIKSFKKGMADDDVPVVIEPVKTLDTQATATVDKAAEARKFS